MSKKTPTDGSTEGIRPHLVWRPLLLVVVAVVSLAGWWSHRTMVSAIKDELATKLQTLLEADVAGLKLWLTAQRRSAEALAARPQVVEASRTLLEVAASSNYDRQVVADSPASRVQDEAAESMRHDGRRQGLT